MRQKAGILGALLGAVFVAAASAGTTQQISAVRVDCRPVDKHSGHIKQVSAKDGPLSYSFEVPAEVFDRGRPVDFKLTIKNNEPTPAALSFSSTQLYDILVWDDQCREVWRWSYGLAFAQVITSISMQPSNPIFYNMRWQRRDQTGHPVRSGTYEARLVFLGRSTARNAPLVFDPLIFDLQ